MNSLRPRRFEIVHNMPAPYRYPIFRELHRNLGLRGLDFHVHFMAKNHHDRPHFEPDLRDLNFPHTFWSDVGPTLKYNHAGVPRKKEWHFNPAMLAYLLRRKLDFLMVGGPWDSLTGMAASLLARRRIGIAWWESNTSNPGRVTGAIAFAKRCLLSTYSCFAVPGEEGMKHAELLVQNNKTRSRCVILPNLIDDKRFTPSWSAPDSTARDAMRARFNIPPNTRLAIWPARFIREKGIPEFLNTVTKQELAGWKILILGKGPLENEIRAVAKKQQLEEHVILESYIGYDDMPAAYNAADILLLPSLEDSNPLTVVEALHCGLPLLLSRRVGNFPEALREGVNGWSLDPFDIASVSRAKEQAFKASLEDLRAMGRQSKQIAEHHWSLEHAIDRFLDGVGAI